MEASGALAATRLCLLAEVEDDYFTLVGWASATVLGQLGCQHEETLHHLFWGCPFAQQCWDFICPTRTPNLSVLEAFQDLKEKLRYPFYMEIIILGAWAICITRNFFENIAPSFQGWKFIFLEELKLLKYRMRKKHERQFSVWLDSLL